MNWLERSLNVSFTVKHVSSAVAITGCSGVKYGLGEAKLSWFLTPRQNIGKINIWSVSRSLFESTVHL